MTYHSPARWWREIVPNKDAIEAWANAAAGLGISLALVWLLRAVGAWDAPAWAVASIFFAASVARSYVLRRAFRAWERKA